MKFCFSIRLSRSLRLLGLALSTALLTVFLSLYGERSLGFLPPATATTVLTTAAFDQQQLDSPAIAQSSLAQRLLQQGREHYQAERFHAAVNTWKETEDRFAEQEDSLNRAITLSNLALAYRQLGQWPEAEAAIYESFHLLGPEASLTDQGLRIYGQALNTQGSVYLAQGQAELALNAWEQATERYTQANYPEGIVKSLINQTYALRSLGFFRQSQARLQETCTTLHTVTDPSLKVALTRSLGETLRLLGNLGNPDNRQSLKQKTHLPEAAVHACQTKAASETEQDLDSLTALAESLDLAKDLNLPVELAKTYISLGDTLRAIAQQREILAQRTGQLRDEQQAIDGYQTALAHYKMALEVYEANPSLIPLTLSVRAMLNQLEILRRLEKFKQAQPTLISWDKAQLQTSLQAQIEALPAGRSSTFAQMKLARWLMDGWVEERPLTIRQQTYNLLAAAKQQAEALGDSIAESYALGYLGHLYELEKQYGDAQKYTEAALELANQQPSIAYQWQWQLGRIEQEFYLEENRSRVLWYYDQAFQTVKTVRNDLLYVEPDVQFDFRDRTEKLYREYISLLLPETKQTKSQDTSDASNLSSALQQAKTVINDLRVAELESFLACGLLEPNSSIPQVPIEQVVNDDKNAAIIYPIILPNGPEGDRLEVLIQLPGQDDAPEIKRYPSRLISPQFLETDSAQASSSPIETALKEFRKELEQPYFSTQRGEHLAEEIYDWIIRPAEEEGWLSSEHIETLVFVLDGAFRNVPMAALRDRNQDEFLIEKYAIAVTFGDLQIPEKPPGKSFTILAAGLSKDPKLSSDDETDIFGPIKYVTNEIQEIEAAIDNTDSFYDEQFTQAGIQAKMRSTAYNIVHLATHGVFDFTRNETYLLAADQNASQDQLDETKAIAVKKINLNQFDTFLRTRNRIPIELLVLSACETATGDDREVLGMAGLAVQSGAESTLATLWSISDLSTSVLMGKFYRELIAQGVSKAQALQQAQIELIDQGYKPSRWAPYLLVGDWR